MKASSLSTPEHVTLDYRVLKEQADPYAAFVRIVEQALDFAIQRLMSHKGKFNSSVSEDQLTLHLLGPLVGMGIRAEHEVDNNGHCDITIFGPMEMKWLGEAKKYSSFPKILGGYRQLVDRYASGRRNQAHGALIIYSFKDKSSTMMVNWKNYLQSSEPETNITMGDEPVSEFRSSKVHRGTEFPLFTLHVAVSMFHKPTDTDAKPKRVVQSRKKSEKLA